MNVQSSSPFPPLTHNLKALFTIYLPALTTLMAAYFGAKYAFDLQNEKEKIL